MRHNLQVWLAVLLALTPIAANANANSDSRSKSATTTTTKKRTPKTVSRRKTQHVSGYTTKKGKKVAPYKRRPPNYNKLATLEASTRSAPHGNV